MKKRLLRLLVEVWFILFLFYANLLMGAFERSGIGQTNSLAGALWEIFTVRNFEIGVIAASIGFIIVEFLRTRL